MKHRNVKLALGSAAAVAMSLVAQGQVQAQSSAPKDPFQNPSVQSYSMVMQSRGRLGAKVITMSEDLRKYFGAPGDQGLLIDSVVSDSPASKAGLKSGDVIVAVEGKPISETWDIMQAMSSAKKGDAVKLDIVRDKKRRTLSATLDSEAMDSPFGQGPGGPNFSFEFGKGDKGFAPEFFGKGKGFGPEFFGKSFPFGHSPLDPGALQEQMQRLEERLNKLEGKPAPKGTQSKPVNPFKTKPGKGASS